MLIHEITLRNLLSFAPNTPALPLRPLNVLIGPNASGKSNLIEAISLLQSAPRLLASPVRDGGGIRDWLWKGEQHAEASIEVCVDDPDQEMLIRHGLSFQESAQRFELVGERIENAESSPGEFVPNWYYSYENNHAVLNVKGQPRELRREEVDPELSILSQRRDPDSYPVITYLASQYERIRIFREWSFGRFTPPRQPQKADLRNDFLAEDCLNVGLVLNRLCGSPEVKAKLLERLEKLYPGIKDIHVLIQGGTVQIFFHEGPFSIPATRLSDGILRYLCLLIILCHPDPPPLICLEEPELGLHPDAIPAVADLLKEAATAGRTQLIVTTHADALVDALSDEPADVIVCEKTDGRSVMKRLDGPALQVWLQKYTLGQLWRRGEIGGNRW